MEKLVIRFAQCSEQSVGSIKKVSGFVKLRNLIGLIDALDLEANPRESKKGAVTDSIMESIERTPEIFPFKTKGLLLGSSSYRALERNRYEVSFVDLGIEGILDGGHNTLAIGMYILDLAGLSESEQRKVKNWSDFRKTWDSNRELIQDFQKARSESDGADGYPLSTLVPVEVLVPSDPDNREYIDDFKASLLDICAARNNNVQLPDSTKNNQIGYFDDLKRQIEASGYVKPGVIEWKTNEGGKVKASDVISLAWIPLTVAVDSREQKYKDEYGRIVESPAPQKVYSGAGDCMTRFGRLMSSPDITTNNDDPRRELKNESILSAFQITADLLPLYDYIYSQLPKLYNENGGSYGRITAVKALNPTDSKGQQKRKHFQKYSGDPVNTASPVGFITPLVYGLIALVQADEDGILSWKTDPRRFLEKHLGAIVKQFTLMFAPYNWDPQKIGKASESYTQSVNAFDTEYLRFAASQLGK